MDVVGQALDAVRFYTPGNEQLASFPAMRTPPGDTVAFD